MAFWSQLMPGQTLAVHYDDDPGIFHERILLWRHSEGFWYILTPDGDRYTEDVRAAGGDGPSRVKVKGKDFIYWSRVGGTASCFRARPSDDEFLDHMKFARTRARQGVGLRCHMRAGPSHGYVRGSARGHLFHGDLSCEPPRFAKGSDRRDTRGPPATYAGACCRCCSYQPPGSCHSHWVGT